MNDSVAIVTGASQGIGRPTANRLARDFSRVVLVARNGNELEEVASEVRQTGAEPERTRSFQLFSLDRSCARSL